MSWSIVLGVFLGQKLSLMIETQELHLWTSVPQHTIVLCLLGDLFIFLNCWNYGAFSGGFYSPQAAQFFQTWFLVFPMSAMLLVSFYWLEISFFTDKPRTLASLSRLKIPAFVMIGVIFLAEFITSMMRVARFPSSNFGVAVR